MIWPFKRRRRYSRINVFTRFYGLVRVFHWTFRLLLILLILDLFYVAANWPDWKKLSSGPIPKSNFIKSYSRDTKKAKHKGLPPLRWRRVPYDKIPPYVVRAAIVAEDSRFYQHDGFDLVAFREAMDHNLTEGRMAFGGSTISQQTVKNLFLTGSRNPLRKWHELLLTWGMEKNLKKRRIMEIYLNIAEFGSGIYGVQAASQHYWNRSVGKLSLKQAAELAACLPSPRKHNPDTRTKAFLSRTEKIYYWLRQSDE